MPKTRIMAFTWSTLKNLFSKPATKNYPAEPIRYPERSRGHIEIDIEDCISCSMCARSCPTGAITVERVRRRRYPSSARLRHRSRQRLLPQRRRQQAPRLRPEKQR